MDAEDGILECRGVTKHFGAKTALVNVNLSLPRGRIVGLLGPNGSGKTTLLKLINGLIRPSAGQIAVNGHPPGAESKALISYLPDKTYFNDWMRVKDLLAFFRDFYYDFRLGVAQSMLASLRIDPSQRLKTLSKGTKEKVQLVLVMARKAKLYLLDEPIAGVDPAARDYILRTILNNYSEDATLLISTHLIQDVEQIFHNVIFLRDGKIVLDGEAEALRAENGMSIDALFREVFKC
ncbi:MAG: ABC transporter ATP-binding protein [Peptococcaceae bacterium]|jgi:ABC-2 type transport system ATP-binding protein|nr:ABC transporter ATP-binding protein [Peptococcaceae bacterium]